MVNSKNVLLVGAAKEEINPPLGARLVRFPFERPCAGIESDLYFRALVFGDLKTGRPSAALAVLDGLYAHADIVSEIRIRAARAVPGLNPQSIMIASTHTHSGPTLQPYLSGTPGEGMISPAPGYVKKVLSAGVLAIRRAWDDRQVVYARKGLTQANLAHNRRVLVDGAAVSKWLDINREHTGYVNKNVHYVLFHKTEGDAVYSAVAGYGCHPVTLGPGNMKASPDYPGYFARRLEERTGAGTVVFVTTGGANINPKIALLDGPQQAQVMGDVLSDVVMATQDQSRRIRTTPIVSVGVPLKWQIKTHLGQGVKELLDNRRRKPLKSWVTTEVQAIRLGELAFVSAPGEPFAEIVTRIEEISPIKHTMMVGHANDALGYIYTDQAAFEGGYEVLRGSVSENMEQPYMEAAIKALKTTLR